MTTENAISIRPRRLTREEIRIDEAIQDKAATDPGFAAAYALIRVAENLGELSYATHLLGVGDAATPMGAVELLAGEVKVIGELLARMMTAARP